MAGSVSTPRTYPSGKFGMGGKDPAATCPRCGKEYTLWQGGLSRWDNETLVCPPCSVEEAAIYRAAGLEASAPHLDPLIGKRPWVNPWAARATSSTND